MIDRIGSELAGYRIERRLGRGGMGVVYLARDARLDRLVALKILAPELAEDDGFRQRFVRETRIAASIDHPNVIPVYEAGEAGGHLYLAMRFVDGMDLGTMLSREGALDLGSTLSIISSVAQALDAAHERGLVHRDVKPGNILLTGGRDSKPFGHVYLGDFGISKFLASEGTLTKTAHQLGTPSYAAPEQLLGEGVDRRTDIYSLGCVLYECLTGTPPYVRSTDAALVYAHVNDPIPLLTTRRPELPRELDDVMLKALAKRPGFRYADCTELLASLKQIQGTTRAAGEGSLAGTGREDGAGPPARRRRSAVRWGVAAALAAAAVAAPFAVRALDRGDSGSAPDGLYGPGGAGSPSAAALIMIQPDGTGERKLPLSDRFLFVASPDWAPSMDRIVFVGAVGAQVDIYTMRVDGSGLVQLTDDAAQDSAPAWSPDGGRIAFVSDRTARDQVYVVDADGGTAKQITNDEGTARAPAWSPVGQLMAFVGSGDGDNEIFLANVDGTGLTQLTHNQINDGSPAWSPDGTKLALHSTVGGAVHIFVMGADGTALRQVTNGEGRDSGPDWSPDGRYIGFASDRDGDDEIYLIAAEGGSEVTKLTDNDVRDGNLQWSPDGSMIVFDRRRVLAGG